MNKNYFVWIFGLLGLLAVIAISTNFRINFVPDHSHEFASPLSEERPKSTIFDAIEDPEFRKHVEDYTQGIELTDAEESKASEEHPIWRIALVRALYREQEAESNDDVLFYGLVLDEEGHPIEGAKLRSQILQFPQNYENRHQDARSRSFELVTTSDSDGLFTISGYRAMSLVFYDVIKDGYVRDGWPPDRGFYFGSRFPSRHVADPDNPVVFRMKREDTQDDDLDWELELVNEFATETEMNEEELALKPDGISVGRWLLMKAFHREEESRVNGEVLFYGQVVDSNGFPLEGVTVTASVSQFPLMFADAVKRYHESGDFQQSNRFQVETHSDTDGRFEISGFRARTIRFLNLELDGYTVHGGMPTGLNTTFGDDYPSRYQARFDDPVVFRMIETE